MAPKKGKKISLNEFLGDSALGSWADEMDSLPNAPAVRSDEEPPRSNDRYGKREDFLASRPERGSVPPREDLPTPTQPPFTAFVGNLTFDLTETELGEFFGSSKTKSIKIIKDRDDKPKGFGYVEFVDLDGLKNALAKSGTNFSGRTIRVSVAEPPKERPGFVGGFDDDSKFDNPWRRDGRLPSLPDSRDSSHRRFEGPPSVERHPPSHSEGSSDWRSSRSSRLPTVEIESSSSSRRKNTGFPVHDGQAGAVNKEEAWTMGSKVKAVPSGPSEDTAGSKFGSLRGRSDMGPPKDPLTEEVDWRTAIRSRPAHSSISPSNSMPPTPQLGRRKLELLPRSGSASVSPSPLSSPKISPSPASSNAARSNPFGAAKPVDVATREREVADRLEKDRLAMSRTNSHAASERSPLSRTRTPPHSLSAPQTPTSPQQSNNLPSISSPIIGATVRPSLSFADAAAKRETSAKDDPERKGDEIVVESGLRVI